MHGIVEETSLLDQRSHDTLAFGILAKNFFEVTLANGNCIVMFSFYCNVNINALVNM